jgi:hypothetical protein
VTSTILAHRARVHANGSACGYINAPDGVQTAFVEAVREMARSIARDVNGLVAGRKYAVRFSVADRGGYVT